MLGLNPFTGEIDTFPLPAGVVDLIRREGGYFLLHADTRRYRKRIKANNGSISDRDLVVIDRFVRRCYALGLKGTANIIQDCSPLAGNNLKAAQVKLWNAPGTSPILDTTIFTEANYSRSGGIDPGGASPTQIISTGFIPANQTELNNVHVSIFSGTDVAERSVDVASVRFVSPARLGFHLEWEDGNTYFDSYTNGARRVAPAGSTKAFFVGNRHHDFAEIIRNGTQVASGSGSEGTSPMVEIRLSGDPQFPSSRRKWFYSLGRAIPNGVHADYYQAVNTMMAAFGRVGDA